MVSATQRLDEGLPRCSSLVDLLQWRAERQPDQVAYRFLVGGELEAKSVTYAQLALQARAIASVLHGSGAKNERALLLFPPGLDYIAAWFGCLYANVVAVPAYPPRAGRSKARIAAIVDDSEPSFVLTTEATRERETLVSGQIPRLSAAKWVVPAKDVTPDDAAHWVDPGATGSTVAFLQYTSGSTSSPKGVIVSHANLLENLRSAHEAFRYSTASSGVSWLPPYHDMGLIGGILHPLYAGFPVVLMSPVAFLQRPARWLEAISRTRATVSAGPNSAYRLCARRVTDEDKAKMDLSTWEVAFNGSEPVRGDVLDEFCEAFKSCGFRREAFYPCYGLAEATLLVSGKQGKGAAKRWWVNDLALQEGRAVTAGPHDDHAQLLVSSGQPAPGVRVVIADPQVQTTCGPNEIGEIWVKSPAVTSGYWRRSSTSEGTFHAHLADVDENAGYLRTGDLGVINEGHLYVTGRLSDLIIIRGKNHYPQDIERTIEECHPALQPDRGAAFSIDVDGEERLVVVHEAPGRKDPSGELAAVLDAIRRDVAEEHQLRPYAVVLIRTYSMPRTSSGKVQRRACRAAFLKGDLEVVAEWRDGRNDGGRERSAHEQSARLPRLASKSYSGNERDGRAAEIRAWLVQAVAERLGGDVNAVDVEQPFTYYGLDSVDAVALSGHLGRWLGRDVEPTLVWDYPTIASAARYLASEQDDVVNMRPNGNYFAEPIAVMGMACRFPGGIGSVEAFWEFLRSGRCGVVEIPADRWDVNAFYDADPEARGKMATRYGAFIDGVDQFDSLFFGISPREANVMDPQQRVLLEVAWEALETAGIAADDLAGTSTGTFIGISTTDYAMHFAGRDIDAYVGTGNAHSIAANRLSYVLGLRGPSMAVDTACSSSLVAVHLACQSLRAGECDLALAGGVNLLLLAETMVNFSQARMLAADGRCKTFDAAADGYGRGEGCGVVVLRRLSDAIASGGPVLAVVRGSAVNHDGRSNGLTAPNGPAQEEVVRRALAAAGVGPLEVGYVEAHGTGTPLGDPIEVRALGRVLAAGRDRRHPLVVGSVKTNLGHLEAAAGVAGLIKAVLTVQRGEIPAHLHFQEPNPHIPWDDLAIEVPTEHRLWEGEPRIAGVSSFGFGGTNAHVIVEGPPALGSHPSPPSPGRVTLVKVAARNPVAARAAAAQLAEFTGSHPEVPLAALAYAAGVGRADLPERVAVVAASPAEAAEALGEAAAGRPAPGVYRGRARPGGAPPVAFVVPGQGGRLAGAAEHLYGAEPAFSAVIDQLAEALGPVDQLPLAALLRPGPASEEALAGTEVAQPAGYALALGLAAWWREAGVEPAGVLGHSVGAYAAAALAGVLAPLDGARLVAARGRLMAELCPPGAMAAIAAPAPVVTAARGYDPAHLAIAAVNTPTETVVSGEAGPLEALVAELSGQGVSCQPLRVNRAFHSALIEPALDALAAELAHVRLAPAGPAFISDTTGPRPAPTPPPWPTGPPTAAAPSSSRPPWGLFTTTGRAPWSSSAPGAPCSPWPGPPCPPRASACCPPSRLVPAPCAGSMAPWPSCRPGASASTGAP